MPQHARNDHGDRGRLRAGIDKTRIDRRTPVDDQADEIQPSGDTPTHAPNKSAGASPSQTPETSQARPALTPDMEAETPEAGAVPPGYDWPTHGGYLGCLLGMMPACLVGGFLGSTFVAWLNAAGVVPPVVAALLVVALFVLSVIGFGRLGWILGRRFYRKYPQAQPTWGEDDVVAEVIAQEQQGQPGEARNQA